MTAMDPEALVAIAAAISVPMASAWVVQQRTGNSGRVDTIWTFSLGLVAIWSLRPGVHIAIRSAVHRARLARQFRFPSRRDRTRAARGLWRRDRAVVKRWRWFATASLFGYAGGNGA
jgi:steroid 5-alpha reductase family enzyme